jgi:TolB protein
VIRKLFRLLVVPLLGLLGSAGAQAGLTIEITQGAEGALPIAIVPFQVAVPGVENNVSDIVAANLRRSGRFKPLPAAELVAHPHEGSEVNFQAWRVLGVENLVVGKVRSGGAGGLVVQFQLFDVFKAVQLAGYSIPVKPGQLRQVAHHISDIIYEKLTGQRGAFSTRIAYVTSVRRAGKSRYVLAVADSDGFNPNTILESEQPLMSPSWSPDGNRLAYVSFEKGHAAIYVQEVASGRREVVAEFDGINGAPSWSPDGKSLALTLSRDGNPEIYVLELSTGSLARLTDNAAIDTEPAWAPDGRSLVFTSDRSGGPQIYRIPVSGGRPERLTFDGHYNARAVYSPDGRYLALVHGDGSGYRIALLDIETGLLRKVSEGNLDESPSFAPNGSMVLYATKKGGRGVLAAVAVEGNVHQRLSFSEGDVREPAWSPFRR